MLVSSGLVRIHWCVRIRYYTQSGKQVTLARALLNSDKVLLVLDGLDEIPPPLRTRPQPPRRSG